MTFQEFKGIVNRLLDEAAAKHLGRPLSFDERRTWWIDRDRYLIFKEDDPEQEAIIEAARVETFSA